MVTEGMEAVYHCMSRCVRRAFLCGRDEYTGQNYEHRKEWIKLRIKELSAGYAVKVAGYAVMFNELYVVVRTRPDSVVSRSDRALVQRWRKIFPKMRKIYSHTLIDL